MTRFDRVYSEVGAEAGREDHAESPARRALLVGVFSSAFLLAVGLLVILLRGEPRPNEPPDIPGMIRGLLGLRGVSLVYLGLLVLSATPILRVGVMIGVYARRRERFMLVVSLAVLMLLGVGILVGAG